MNTKSIWDAQEQRVTVEFGSVHLEAELTVPETAEGIILFAHSGGSSIYSTRNHYFAHILRQVGLATILINLLTKEEEAIDQRTRHYRHNIKHLAERIIEATNWLANNPITCNLKVGYFGDGVGSGAALLAAAEHPMAVKAIVSRSGQIDLVGEALCYVQVPTLLIVGAIDLPVIAMNEDALALIPACKKQLEMIPGATHHFDEPGAQQEVGRLASQWFKHFLTTTDERDLHIHAMSIV